MQEIERLAARKQNGDTEAGEKMEADFDEVLRMETLASMGINCEADIPREEDTECFTTTQRE